MIYYLILLLFILSLTFEQSINNHTFTFPCFCNCCATKSCWLEIQNEILQVETCDDCDSSCRLQFSACQSHDGKEKIFGLCSTDVDKHGRSGKNDYMTVKAADVLLGIGEDKLTLHEQLKDLRQLYDKKVKDGTTSDKMPSGEHPVKTAISTQNKEKNVEKTLDNDHKKENTMAKVKTAEIKTNDIVTISSIFLSQVETIADTQTIVTNNTTNIFPKTEPNQPLSLQRHESTIMTHGEGTNITNFNTSHVSKTQAHHKTESSTIDHKTKHSTIVSTYSTTLHPSQHNGNVINDNETHPTSTTKPTIVNNIKDVTNKTTHTTNTSNIAQLHHENTENDKTHSTTILSTMIHFSSVQKINATPSAQASIILNSTIYNNTLTTTSKVTHLSNKTEVPGVFDTPRSSSVTHKTTSHSTIADNKLVDHTHPAETNNVIKTVDSHIIKTQNFNNTKTKNNSCILSSITILILTIAISTIFFIR